MKSSATLILALGNVSGLGVMNYSRRGFFGLLGAAAVSAALPTPPARKPVSMVRLAKHVDAETGISLRVIRSYDPQADLMITRLDCLYRFPDPYPYPWVAAVAA